MKNKLVAVVILLLFLTLCLSYDIATPYAFSVKPVWDYMDGNPQSTQKPKFDYMSSILSRNTKPLGLKENVSLKKLLDQPSIIWAMRSGRRHILN